jgi:hypothetical protein
VVWIHLAQNRDQWWAIVYKHWTFDKIQNFLNYLKNYFSASQE